jgi:glycerophosphoryl diester phosphodiesterase
VRGGATRRWLLVAALVALASAALVVLALESRFAGLKADPLDLPRGTRVWAHRGTHGGFQGEGKPMNRTGENTLEAFEASIANGFTGIELDIHFMPERGFIVAHDLTPADHLGLNEVFARCGRKVYYWLDFKNLTDENVGAVIVVFNRLFERYPIRDRVLIESPEARALARLRNGLGDVKVLYWIQWYRGGFEKSVLRARKRWKLAWFGFRNISISNDQFNEVFLRDFARMGIYVYTINGAARMAALRDAGVRVILTDRDRLPSGIPP